MSALHHTRRDGMKEICPYCCGATKVMADCDAAGEEWVMIFCQNHKKSVTDSHEINIGLTASGKVSILAHRLNGPKAEDVEIFLSKETAHHISELIQEAIK